MERPPGTFLHEEAHSGARRERIWRESFIKRIVQTSTLRFASLEICADGCTRTLPVNGRVLWFNFDNRLKRWRKRISMLKIE
jgi:hypothetical protein